MYTRKFGCKNESNQKANDHLCNYENVRKYKQSRIYVLFCTCVHVLFRTCVHFDVYMCTSKMLYSHMCTLTCTCVQIDRCTCGWLYFDVYTCTCYFVHFG